MHEGAFSSNEVISIGDAPGSAIDTHCLYMVPFEVFGNEKERESADVFRGLQRVPEG